MSATLSSVAKELGVSAKKLLPKAQALGINVSSLSSSITLAEAQLLMDHFKMSLRELRALRQGAGLDLVTDGKKRKPAIKIRDVEGKRQDNGAALQDLSWRVLQLEKSVDHALNQFSTLKNQLPEAMSFEHKQQLELLLENFDLVSSTIDDGLALVDHASGVDQKIVLAIEEVKVSVARIDNESLQIRSSLKKKASSQDLLSVKKHQKQLHDNQSRLADSMRELRAICDDLIASRNDRKDKQLRIDKLVQASHGLSSARLTCDYDDLNRKLEACGLYFDRRVIEDCISGIRVGKMLLLSGAPGTGKTSLARLLPTAFFEPGADELLTEREAEISWQSFDVLGGKWSEGGEVVPYFGVFTESVLRCVEQHGKHWLFIDELNRCNPDRAFSGIMSVLASPVESRNLKHPAIERTIKIPDSYRMICAMNDHDDRYLFPISNALKDRFKIVKIEPPSLEVERRIVNENCLLYTSPSPRDRQKSRMPSSA